jgi:AraC-like DNA-binding protein
VPEIDLAEVALAAGFADQSHFTRVFKNVTGITPGVYRQMLATK